MSKIQILFASVFAILTSIIFACFIYTEDIRNAISNKYYLVISFLVLFLILNIYSTEFKDKNRNENDVDKDNGMKYITFFSISLFSIAGIVFSIHILLFIIEWIKSLFN